MKKLVFALIAIAAFTFASCGDPKPQPTSTPGQCTIVHEGTTYNGPCEEIQRVIDQHSPAQIQ